MTNRDSIKSKIFEEGGGGLEGAGETFSRKFLPPPPPNIHTLNNDTDPT